MSRLSASGAGASLRDRVEGLLDEARPGRPRTIDDDQVAAVIERTLRSTPADATTGRPGRWQAPPVSLTRRSAGSGRRSGFSRTAQRPSSCRAIRCSSTSLATFVGLYLSPPTHALVLSVDEKSQIQALDIASAFVIGKCYKRHRATEFLDFLKQIDAQVPPDLDVHIIMDNYATHKTALVRSWLARRSSSAGPRCRR